MYNIIFALSIFGMLKSLMHVLDSALLELDKRHA